MKLRKANAWLSLLTTVLLMNHAVFLSVWMLSRCRIAKPAENMSWALAGLMAAHALLSIVLGVLAHKEGGQQKGKSYPQMNIPTILQRATGVLMLLMIGLHIAGAANHFQPKILHAILHPLFFGVVLAHTAVSAGKALITLGLGTEKMVKRVDAVMRALCMVTFAAGVIGFYLCLFVGVVR